MVLQYTAICVPAAHAQAAKQTTAVAVVPFTDNTGYKSQIVSSKATDAIALALEDSTEFVVSSQADLQREMKALSLVPPMLESEQVRIGKRLRVDKVISGTVESLSIEAKTGRCNVSIDMRSLDVNTEEYLNGASVSVTTKPIPGWEGDDVRVINEGLREAAEEAVRKMMATRTPRGNVDLVDDQGTITLNVGMRDGVVGGKDFLVARPQWQPDQEKVFMRKIGTITIDDVDANMSRAHYVSGLMPRVGDKVYALYRPGKGDAAPPRGPEDSGGGHGHGAIAAVVGVLALLLVAGIGRGPDSTTASQAQSANLQQLTSSDVLVGNPPVIVLNWTTGNTERSATQGYMIFRGDGTAVFPTEEYILDAETDSGGHVTRWVDSATPTAAAFPIITSRVITWQAEATTSGSTTTTLTTYTVTVATMTHPALAEGLTYNYAQQRIITPMPEVGSGGGTTTTTTSAVVRPQAAASITLSLPGVTSQPLTFSPVTYILPPTLQAGYPNGNTNITSNDIEFRWQANAASAGPNVVYRLETYSDAGMTHLIDVSPETTMTTNPMIYDITNRQNVYQPVGATFYFRVGARVVGETRPGAKLNSYVYSAQGSFKVAVVPPNPPSGSSTSAVKATNVTSGTQPVTTAATPTFGQKLSAWIHHH
jgi:hypothetical protein